MNMQQYKPKMRKQSEKSLAVFLSGIVLVSALGISSFADTSSNTVVLQRNNLIMTVIKELKIYLML